MALLEVTHPATEPLSLDEAKHWCRDTSPGTDQEAWITTLIAAARRAAEQYMERALITQSWKLFLDVFPEGLIRVPLPPLISVSSVKYIKPGESAYTAIDSANYRVDTVSQPGRIGLAPSACWPTPSEEINAVEVAFQAGYGGASAVPKQIKTGIAMMVRHWYDHRALIESGAMSISKVPETLTQLFDYYRVSTF